MGNLTIKVITNFNKSASRAKYFKQSVKPNNTVDKELLDWFQNYGGNIQGELKCKPATDASVYSPKSPAYTHSTKPRNPKYTKNSDIPNYRLTIQQIQNASTNITDWGNTGWKLHIPVKPDTDSTLTNDICEFLNKKWGLDKAKRIDCSGNVLKNAPSFFQQGADGMSRYKVGRCANDTAGKGMTIYGTTGSKEEIFKLAEELENKFGTRIAQSGYPIYAEEMNITPHISARFVDHTQVLGLDKHTDYCHHINKDSLGHVVGKNYGTCVSSIDNFDKSHFPKHVHGNKVLENEFMAGDSVVTTIRDYGEMFTGKIKDGKIPDFIIESFSPEYLKYNPNLIQELPTIIKEGNLRYTKAMLKSIAKTTYNPFGTKIPPLSGSFGKMNYLAQTDKKLIEQAKQELVKENSNFISDYSKNLKDYISIYPQLSVLL